MALSFPLLVSSADNALYSSCLLAIYLIAAPTFISLHFIQAPYGRHRRSGWGPTIPAALAWFLMEGPTVYFFALVYICGSQASSPRSLALLSVFLLHYIHRTCIYPLRLRKGKGKDAGSFPISVALMAFAFNLLNSYVQARWVSHYGHYDADRWFWWRFSAGLPVFLIGMAANVWADMVLVNLKAQSGGRYKVPRGGLFELLTCPNYFGEIVEWLGWTIMTSSWAGFAFFLYTCANLVPRARANRLWYLQKFGDDYPNNRKAVIPFLY